MTPWLSLALSLVAVAAGIIIVRRIVDRRSGSDAVLEEIRREIGAILTEMNQTTERNIELVEDSIERLKGVIDDADRRVTVLKRETKKQDGAGLLYSHLSAASRVQSMPPDRVAGEADTSEAAGNTAKVPEAPGPAREPAASAEPEQREVPLKERVLALYRQGISVERIASRVGTAVSEIELIVSLGERK